MCRLKPNSSISGKPTIELVMLRAIWPARCFAPVDLRETAAVEGPSLFEPIAMLVFDWF
jgi:hypothetical protein